MSRFLGVFLILLSVGFAVIASMHGLNFLSGLDAQGSGAGQRLILSGGGAALFSYFALRSFKIGKHKLTSLNVSPARLAALSAKAFQSAASVQGFSVQLPFVEHPYIATFPLMIPAKAGVTLAYADFSTFKITLVTKSVLKNVPDERKEKKTAAGDFLPNLFGLLQEYGYGTASVTNMPE